VSYLLLCAWGFCIFCAFLGYGIAVFRILKVRNAPWALAATTGVSLLLAVGGLLNLTAEIVAPVLVALIMVGDLLALWGFRSEIKRLPLAIREGYAAITENRRTLLLTILLAALLAVPVLRNVRVHNGYFSHDDLAAYINLPSETLQLASLPSDPFNERRITSTLGGSYFLQTFMLVVGDERTVPFIDVSVGFILYAAVLWGIFRHLELSVTQSLALVLLIFIAPLFRANFTMVILPAGLFAALFWIEIHPALGDRTGWRRSILLGLTAAALCCLKSNYLPPAVLICLFYYVFGFISQPRLEPIRSAGLCALVTISSLLPWMIDMKRKEATYLFPILGRGYDASAYGVIPLPSGSVSAIISGSLWMWLALAPLAAPLFLALAAALMASRKRIETEWVALCSFLVAAAVGVVAVAASTGGESMGRYTLPFEVPAMLIFAGFVFRWRNALQPTPLWLNGATAVVAAALVYHSAGFGVYAAQYRRYAQDAGLAPSPKHFDTQVEKKRIAALQALVPTGEPILAHLSVSFPFDFRRNPVFIADWVGMAGLPPGMPVAKGPDAVRTYLLKHSIRYVAYDCRHLLSREYDPGTSVQTVLANPRRYGRHGWLYIEGKISEDEDKNLAALGRTYKHLYDDGETYVFDLEAKSGIFSLSTSQFVGIPYFPYEQGNH
jgi:hypothetical protein